LVDGALFSLLVVIVLAVVFDYINGFHDTANAIATSVATRALHPRHAILMATFFNFVGAFAGTAVAKTIGAGLVDETTTTQAVVAAALIGAITWNLITWWFGLPSSSSHALIGGLLGATIVAAGVGALKLDGIYNKVVVPMISSPVIGLGLLEGVGEVCLEHVSPHVFREQRGPVALAEHWRALAGLDDEARGLSTINEAPERARSSCGGRAGRGSSPGPAAR